MIKRILVGLGDQAHSASATQQAIRVALANDAELTGVTLFDVHRLSQKGPVPAGGSGVIGELREHRLMMTKQIIEDAIDHFETACRKANVRYSIRQEQGDPFEGLISLSRYHDLIVCGLKNLFVHGVVDEPPIELVKLVQEGVRPLVAVTDQDLIVHRVLIAYSGSVGSAQTMRQFVHLNPWPNASVRIVVFQKPPAKARQLLDDAAEYCLSHGLAAKTEYVPDHPKHILLPYARDNLMDAVILGNSARHLLLRRVFGETALETITNADRTLFLCQ